MSSTSSLEAEAATLQRENTDRVANCSVDDNLVANRTLAKEHGVVTTGPRAQATLINAVSGRLRAMLAQAGLLGAAKTGAVDGGGLRLPNGFANDPELWLRDHAASWRLLGWPSNLPTARISAWPTAQSYAALALLLEGRIVLCSTAPTNLPGSTVTMAAGTRITAPQEVEPPKARPRKSTGGGEDGRSAAGTAAPESDVEDKGDEMEVLGLLDVPGMGDDDAPSPSGLSASVPPDSDVESATKAKGKGKAKAKVGTIKQRMLGRKPKQPAPRVAIVEDDAEESDAQTTDASATSTSASPSEDEHTDDDTPEPRSRAASRAASRGPQTTSPAKSIESEPGSSKAAKPKGRKRPSDAADGGDEPPAKKHKRSKSGGGGAFDPEYRAALEREKAAEKERKKAERERLREERAAQKEQEKRERREKRAMKEAAKEMEQLAKDSRVKRGVDTVEETAASAKGHKRRQSVRSDLGLDDREAKRLKADLDA